MEPRHPILIMGSGLCGLSAAYHLQKPHPDSFLILERNQKVGGLACTEIYDGFSFDHSIHILYTGNPYAADLICNQLLGRNLCKQTRESFCYTGGVYTEYPYQANNYGLPPEIIAENILGLIEAHYAPPRDDPPPHFEEWIYRTFGKGIADHFMIPYNRRVWAWDLKEMNYDWIAERVPMPKIREVLLGAIKAPEKKYGPNREFWYPIEGGIEALARSFLRFIPEERIRFNSNIVVIDAPGHELVLADGQRYRYEWLISAAPLPLLIRMLGKAVPQKIQECAAALKNNIVHTVNIGLEGTRLGVDKLMHWIYYPEEKTVFHRISFPHHFAEWMVPQGCSSIQAEISESTYCPRNRTTLINETLDDLVQVGILDRAEARPTSEGGRVRVARVMTLNPAYIIYDLNHRQHTQQIKEYLRSLHIETRGRFGEWEYFNMDHTILSGKAAVDAILTG